MPLPFRDNGSFGIVPALPKQRVYVYDLKRNKNFVLYHNPIRLIFRTLLATLTASDRLSV